MQIGGIALKFIEEKDQKGNRLFGIDFGPSPTKAADIRAIQKALGIKGDLFLNNRFNIAALQPTKPLNIKARDGRVITTHDFEGPVYRNEDGFFRNFTKFGFLFNAQGLNGGEDRRTLAQAMDRMERLGLNGECGWDSQRFWICFAQDYTAWGAATLVSAFNNCELYIGTTLGCEPRMFILLKNEVGPIINQIENHFAASLMGMGVA